MQKITPFLWFDNNAEEAVNLYTSLFKKAKIVSTSRYDEDSAAASGQKAGSVMTMEFELDGQRFIALNGGPHFKFSGAISFMVYCKTQEDIDRLWNGLKQGGEELPCGWVKDKYGVHWQIVPEVLHTLL